MKNWTDDDLTVGDFIKNKWGDICRVTWTGNGHSTYERVLPADTKDRPACSCDLFPDARASND